MEREGAHSRGTDTEDFHRKNEAVPVELSRVEILGFVTVCNI